MNVGNPLYSVSRNQLSRRLRRAKIVLFGSQGKKNAEGSEIDLLILVNQDKIVMTSTFRCNKS